MPVCVDTAMLPSGRVTLIGLEVGSTSKMMSMSLREIKLPVVPVSALAKTEGVNGLQSSFFSLCFKTIATEDVLSPSTPTPQAFFPFI